MPITVDGVTYANTGDWNRAMDAQAVANEGANLPSAAPRDLTVSPDLLAPPFGGSRGATARQPYLQERPAPVATAGGADPLDIIEHFESGGRNIMQQALPAGGGYNPSVGRVTGPSTASGYWQITNTTWRETAPKVGVDVSQYPTAMSAPKEVQRAVAAQLYKEHGYAPWAPFNPRLAQAVGWNGMRAGGALPLARGYAAGAGGAAGAGAPAAAQDVAEPQQSALSRALGGSPLNLQLAPSSPQAAAAPAAHAMRSITPLQPVPLPPAPNLYGGYQDALASVLNGQRRGVGSIFG